MQKFESFSRSNIFVGDIVKIGDLLFKNENVCEGSLLYSERKIEFSPYFFTDEYKFLRKILFLLIENQRELIAYDLLYDSPMYPVLDYKFYEETCACLPHVSILIANSYNMNNYLKAMGCGEQLNLKEIKNIRKNVFGKNHLDYFHNYRSSLTNEEIKKYWEVILKAKDRSINEFLLDRFGDMAKIYNEEHLVGYHIANFLELNRLAKNTYLEHKYNRFEPDSIERKDKQKILIRK